MQAAFALPWPMLPNTAPAGTRSVEPAVCGRVDVWSASVSPGAVAPGAEGPDNLLPYTGQHVAGLCNQAMANCAKTALADACSKILPALLFACACVHSTAASNAHAAWTSRTTSARAPAARAHRTGDGSYVPCSGTLLLYAMPKLLHDATSFDLLPPGVELDMTTLRADVACCVCVDERKVGNNPSRIVEGMWLGAELQTRGGPVEQTTKWY